MCHEAKIYQKLGEHHRLPKIVKWDPDTCCLTMEYLGNGDLGTYVKKHHDTISPELRLRWAKQAAEGLQLLHSAEIIHCDISPRNFLLDADLNLKICDFAGSSMSGSKPSSFADPRYRPDGGYDAAPRIEDDIFALGSLIYFICTAQHPHGEVASDEVEKRYQSQQFPEDDHLTCGEIIRKCWNNQVDAAQLCSSFGDL
jgi:serine/threonine protein kinase